LQLTVRRMISAVASVALPLSLGMYLIASSHPAETIYVGGASTREVTPDIAPFESATTTATTITLESIPSARLQSLRTTEDTSRRLTLHNSWQPISNLNPASLPATTATVVNAPAFLNPAADLFLEQFASLHAVAKSTDEYLTSPLEQWHQQFLHDTPDPYWSSMAQAQVESSLYASMSSTIELVSVQCASSVCEIQVASNSAQVSERAASEWQSTLSKMASESWWQSYGFDSQNYAQSIASDGRAVFVSYFNRAGYTP
jgi:hypothetical protein